MPIRTVPITELKVEHARNMIERRVREDRTLDYKEVLDVSDSGKLDLLQDVTAMANASGGTILYGAVEGEGEDRGLIVDLRGMPLQPDRIELTVTNLLRDSVDERILNVQHRAIPTGDGTYLYVIRVPASPRAPHMITMKSHRPRFYMRGTVSNDPMNAQQIREVAMRSETAYDRAREVIAQRVGAIREYAENRANILSTAKPEGSAGADFIALHLIPLFPPIGGMDLSPRAIQQRWNNVSAFRWTTNNVRIGLDGLAAEYGSFVEGGAHAWTMLLRQSGIECVQIDNTESDGQGNRSLSGLGVEIDVLHALDEAQQLAAEDLLTTPLVVSLRLHGVSGVMLVSGRRAGQKTSSLGEVPIEPMLLSGWDEAPAVARTLFHVMWQAWGFARSPWYNDDGTRIPAPQR